MGTSRKKRPKRKGNPGRRTNPYPFEFRLKVVKLFLEDGYPVSLIAEQFSISHHSIRRWSKSYREKGEQGLFAKERKPCGSKVPPVVTRSIVTLKKENPGYGGRRISDVLKRFFLIRTSPSTVQRTLVDKGLNTRQKRSPERIPANAFFRTGQTQPDVAERHPDVSPGREERLPDRLSG